MVVEFSRNLFPFFLVAAPEYRKERSAVRHERVEEFCVPFHDALYEPFCGLEWRFTANLKSFGSLCVSAWDEPGSASPENKEKAAKNCYNSCPHIASK